MVSINEEAPVVAKVKIELMQIQILCGIFWPMLNPGQSGILM